MPKKTRVDCVELQHRGGEAVRRAIEGMTREEELAYWARRTEEFLKEREAARKRRAEAAAAK
jgi:hypothetical protein